MFTLNWRYVDLCSVAHPKPLSVALNERWNSGIRADMIVTAPAHPQGMLE